MSNQSKFQLMQRCMARLEEDISPDERIKILKVLASTAAMLVNELEIYTGVA
jgi:hypothetical protein